MFLIQRVSKLRSSPAEYRSILAIPHTPVQERSPARVPSETSVDSAVCGERHHFIFAHAGNYDLQCGLLHRHSPGPGSWLLCILQLIVPHRLHRCLLRPAGLHPLSRLPSPQQLAQETKLRASCLIGEGQSACKVLAWETSALLTLLYIKKCSLYCLQCGVPCCASHSHAPSPLLTHCVCGAACVTPGAAQPVSARADAQPAKAHRTSSIWPQDQS